VVARKELECVIVETDDEGISWVTFNRPEKRNAMSPQLHYDMEEVMMALEVDPDTKVIVLTGAGNSWSAGMDLREYFRATDGNPGEQFRSFAANRRWSWDVLSNSRKPSIAMVNGYCFGGAFIPLCACDIVITDEEAIFGLSEVNWGILPGGIVSKVIVDVMSHRDALFYAMTGRTFDGAKAVEMKLANIAVPGDKLRDETVAMARELMEKNATVLAFTKQAVRAVEGMDTNLAYEYLRAKSQALQFVDKEGTREHGMTEFLDKKTYRPGFSAVKVPDD
jgi:trans-feruloyl-CoA hydratase/vanillin synthase